MSEDTKAIVIDTKSKDEKKPYNLRSKNSVTPNKAKK